MSATSFPHSSFFQVINAVMLWPVHIQKVSQASKHLCPAKLQTRCDVCCACQSTCTFIPSNFGMDRAEDPNEMFAAKHCTLLCVIQGSPFHTFFFFGSRFTEFVRMIAR